MFKPYDFEIVKNRFGREYVKYQGRYVASVDRSRKSKSFYINFVSTFEEKFPEIEGVRVSDHWFITGTPWSRGGAGQLTVEGLIKRGFVEVKEGFYLQDDPHAPELQWRGNRKPTVPQAIALLANNLGKHTAFLMEEQK